MNRRELITGALALALAPKRAYSFVGGWALPPYFIEFEDGTVREIFRKQQHVLNPWSGEQSVYYEATGAIRGLKLARVRTLECESFFRNSRLVYTTHRYGDPIPMVVF